MLHTKKPPQESWDGSVRHPLGFPSLNLEVIPMDIFSLYSQGKYFAKCFLVIKKWAVSRRSEAELLERNTLSSFLSLRKDFLNISQEGRSISLLKLDLMKAEIEF